MTFDLSKFKGPLKTDRGVRDIYIADIHICIVYKILHNEEIITFELRIERSYEIILD